MLKRLNAASFFKVCTGITLVLSSLSLLFFSMSYSTVKAGEPAKNKMTNYDYQIVGMHIDGNRVKIYGYDPGAEYGRRIKVLESQNMGY
jgi:hypothetical protein